MNYASQLVAKLTEYLPDCDPELIRLYALAAMFCGQEVTNEDVHDAWALFTSARRPDHAYLVPFYELPEEIQELDAPYRDAIRRAAKEVL